MNIELNGEKLLDRVERLAEQVGKLTFERDELKAITPYVVTATAGTPTPAATIVGPVAREVLRKLAQSSRDYPGTMGTAVFAAAVENNLEWSEIHALRAEMEGQG